MLLGWLLFGLLGSLVLYVGYGFAMAAKQARDLGLSQAGVVTVDVLIVTPFIVLDALLNLFFYSIVFLDFRRKAWLTLVTGRLSFYNSQPNERQWRRDLTDVFAAFLDGKDPDRDHVRGANARVSWLSK